MESHSQHLLVLVTPSLIECGDEAFAQLNYSPKHIAPLTSINRLTVAVNGDLYAFVDFDGGGTIAYPIRLCNKCSDTIKLNEINKLTEQVRALEFRINRLEGFTEPQ